MVLNRKKRSSPRRAPREPTDHAVNRVAKAVVNLVAKAAKASVTVMQSEVNLAVPSAEKVEVVKSRARPLNRKQRRKRKW